MSSFVCFIMLCKLNSPCYFWTRLILLPKGLNVASLRFITLIVTFSKREGRFWVQKIRKAVNPKWYRFVNKKWRIETYIIAGKWKENFEIVGMSCNNRPYLLFVFLSASACWGFDKVNSQQKLSRDKTHCRVFVIWKVVFCIGRVCNMVPAKS